MKIGEQDFFHAFFSTVSYNLETNGWGWRFPCLLTKLYQGKQKQIDAQQALEELDVISAELKKFSPHKVIWEIEIQSLPGVTISART